MRDAATIQRDLITAFGFLEGHVRIQRERRIYVDVDYPYFAAVFDHSIQKLGFIMLCTITGLDEGERIGLIYHLTDEAGVVLSIKTTIPKANPVMRTVMNRFPCAEIYEREIIDLLGVKVEDLPDGQRYPLPDDWPAGQYPLRKDWKAS